MIINTSFKFISLTKSCILPDWSRFKALKLWRITFVFFLFSTFRFLCWSTRTWCCSAVSFLRLDSERPRSFSSRTFRCSSVSFLRLDSVRSRSFSSRTFRCSSVSFLRLDSVRSPFRMSRTCRWSVSSFLRRTRARSRSSSSRTWRWSGVSFFRLDLARSLLSFSWFWRCWSILVVGIESAHSTPFSTGCWWWFSDATLSSRISSETRGSWTPLKVSCSLRKRRLGEDWNSGTRTWMTALFLNVLFSGVYVIGKWFRSMSKAEKNSLLQSKLIDFYDLSPENAQLETAEGQNG